VHSQLSSAVMSIFGKEKQIRNDPYSTEKPSPPPGSPEPLNYRCPICQADVRESMRACCLVYGRAIAQAETPVV
jgi:hypothetical protein